MKIVLYKGRRPSVLGAKFVQVDDFDAALREMIAQYGFDFLLVNQVFLYSGHKFVFAPYFKILEELFPRKKSKTGETSDQNK